jgi:hypothetical protein
LRRYILLRVLSDEFCDARAEVRFWAEVAAAKANGRSFLNCMLADFNSCVYRIDWRNRSSVNIYGGSRKGANLAMGECKLFKDQGD